MSAAKRFLSTLPVRGATAGRAVLLLWCNISIHAPREGSDLSLVSRVGMRSAFLSTLPVRGATGTYAPGRHYRKDFYPRSP